MEIRMIRQFILCTAVVLAGLAAAETVSTVASRNTPDDLVLVKGGTFKNTESNYYGKSVTLSGFYIGRYEVTQKEWIEVMGTNP